MGRKYTREVLEPLVRDCRSLAEILRALGKGSYSGASSNLLKARIQEYGLDTSHFMGYRTALGRRSNKRRVAASILVLSEGSKRTPTDLLRRALLEIGVSHVCGICGTGNLWCGMPLVLQIDHIDGNWRDSRRENLRFACPNCHSQTDTFGRKPLPP